MWKAICNFIKLQIIATSILATLFLVAEYVRTKVWEKRFNEMQHELNVINTHAFNKLNMGLFWIKATGEQLDQILTEPGMKLKRLNR